MSIAMDIINGEICQECCGMLDDDQQGMGFPQTCAYCIAASGLRGNLPKCTTKIPCPICGKKVKETGLEMHTKAVHGETT